MCTGHPLLPGGCSRSVNYGAVYGGCMGVIPGSRRYWNIVRALEIGSPALSVYMIGCSRIRQIC